MNVIELALQSDPLKTYFLVPWYMEKYLRLLNINFDVFIREESKDKLPCLLVKPGTHIYWSTLNDNLWGTKFESLDYVFQKFSDNAFRLVYNQSSSAIAYYNDNKSNRKRAVFINRKGTREMSFDVFLGVNRVLHEGKNNWDVQYFHGNETLDETVRLFSTAHLIFGFHGAGFVNAFFSTQSAVLVFEISFYMERENKVWRFNSGEFSYAKQMIVVPYMLNPDQNMGSDSAKNGQVMKQVVVNKTDIFNIQQTLRMALREQQHALLSLPCNQGMKI